MPHSEVTFSEVQTLTVIAIMYVPFAVDMLRVSPLCCDSCGSSQEIWSDSSRLCRSNVPSNIFNLLKTSQTTCSCNSFTVLSHSHGCVLPLSGECCCDSAKSWSWSAISASMPLPRPGNCELPSCSGDRCEPAILLLRWTLYSGTLSSVCLEKNKTYFTFTGHSSWNYFGLENGKLANIPKLIIG